MFGPTWESHGPAGRSLQHFRSCLFPQPSTTKISILVTNNLDREFQTAQAHYMREGSPNQFAATDPRSGLQSAANSLFPNILAISPCGSRFCGAPSAPRFRKPLKINILTQRGRKNEDAGMLLSPMFPRFYPQNIEPVRFIFDFPLTP